MIDEKKVVEAINEKIIEVISDKREVWSNL